MAPRSGTFDFCDIRPCDFVGASPLVTVSCPLGQTHGGYELACFEESEVVLN